MRSRSSENIARCSLEPLEPRFVLSSILVPIAPLGNADGHFADLDGDGFADQVFDVAATQSAPAQIKVAFADGDGHFRPPVILANNERFSAIADFDADGKPDLLAQSGNLIRNRGNRQFEPVAGFGALAGATSVRPFNFDNDGRADLLIISAGQYRILRSTPAGLIDPGIVSNVGDTTILGVADLDRDGDDDLVTISAANLVHPVENTRVALVEHAAVQVGPHAVLGDSDSDGVADIYSVDGANAVSATSSDGHFGFAASRPLGTVDGTLNAIVDLDQDGKAEVVTTFVDSSGERGWVYWGSANLDIPRRSEVGDLAYADQTSFVFANVSGDARLDAICVQSRSQAPVHLSTIVWGTVDPISIAGAWSTPSGPVIPGAAFQLSISGVSFVPAPSAGASVRFFVDLNGDGVADPNAEPWFAAQQTGADTWSASVTLADRGVAAGRHRFLAVASTSTYSLTSAAAADTEFWERSFYAEGWRNDATVNEYVSFANPNAETVSYRVYARYETGDTDVLISQGTLLPNSRGGITVVERGNAAGALVRAGVGYAIEVQSSLPIGAFFSHYDNFGTTSESSTAAGEALSNQTSVNWGFADVSTERFDFLLFYNPTDLNQHITATFYDADSNPYVVEIDLAARRRGGLAVRDIANLPRNAALSAVISSTGAFFACQTVYDPAHGEGFSNPGMPLLNPIDQMVLPALGGLSVRGSSRPVVTLFNPQSTAATITMEFVFDGGATSVSRTVSLDSHRRQQIDVYALAPAGVHAAAVHVTTDRAIVAQASQADHSSVDSASAGTATFGANAWAFGDAFMDRNLAGTSFREFLDLYNPTDTASTVTVRYLFTDGSQASREVTLAAHGVASLALHDETAITGHAVATWYSIAVASPTPFLAWLSHWDVLNGGGWSSLGTPIGTLYAIS